MRRLFLELYELFHYSLFLGLFIIIIEQKLYKCCYRFQNFLVFYLDLHHDIFFFLILILVFVSRILVRALWHFHYNKCRDSWVPKIEKTFSISTCIVCFYMYFTGVVQIAQCADNPDLELRLGPPGTPLERGESLPNLNELPKIVYEQRIQIPNNKFINVELQDNEMASLINRLPKAELQDVIRADSILKPLKEFNAEQQAQLRDIAIRHFEFKNEIIAKMKSLYPNDEWELTKVIREKFFQGRQKDRESSLEDLQRMLSALNEQGKSASCSKRLRYNISYWNWKE